MPAALSIADEHRSAVERILRQVAAGAMAVDAALVSVLAATGEAAVSVNTKERERAEGQRLLARYDELVERGRGRNAAMIVAKEFGQPHEWETIADRVRRLRANRKSPAT